MTSVHVSYGDPFVSTRRKSSHGKHRRHEINHKQTGSLPMKTLVLGMMFAASLGPLVLMDVDPDKLFARNLSYSLVGGTFGSVICFCVFLMDDFRQMARHSLGNLLIAVSFGPTATEAFSAHYDQQITPGMLVTISALLGIGGVFILKAAGPMVLKLIPTVFAMIPVLIRRWAGVPEPKSSD